MRSTGQALTFFPGSSGFVPEPGFFLSPAAQMQPQESSVQYSRWEDGGSRDGVSVASGPGAEEAAGWARVSRELCSGKLGISLKVLGGVALFWAVFILGYITGYYVHKCK